MWITSCFHIIIGPVGRMARGVRNIDVAISLQQVVINFPHIRQGPPHCLTAVVGLYYGSKLRIGAKLIVAGMLSPKCRLHKVPSGTNFSISFPVPPPLKQSRHQGPCTSSAVVHCRCDSRHDLQFFNGRSGDVIWQQKMADISSMFSPVLIDTVGWMTGRTDGL